MRVVFGTNINQVIAGLRIRRRRAYELVAEGADELAAWANDTLIPSFYPGRVRDALVAVSEPYISGGRLAAVRFHRTNRLFDFYEFGVSPHPEDASTKPMTFEWEKMGGDRFWFWHVDHPGYEGRHHKPALREAFREQARIVWAAKLHEAMLL